MPANTTYSYVVEISASAIVTNGSDSMIKNVRILLNSTKVVATDLYTVALHSCAKTGVILELVCDFGFVIRMHRVNTLFTVRSLVLQLSA